MLVVFSLTMKKTRLNDCLLFQKQTLDWHLRAFLHPSHPAPLKSEPTMARNSQDYVPPRHNPWVTGGRPPQRRPSLVWEVQRPFLVWEVQYSNPGRVTPGTEQIKYRFSGNPARRLEPFCSRSANLRPVRIFFSFPRDR